MSATIGSVARVQLAAAAAGMAIEIVEMEKSTRTAEEAAAACGTSVAEIVKSLVFKGASSGKAVLLLVSGKNRVDERAIAGEIGEALERLDARTVRDITGFAIGGVAPIGALTPLATYMDRDLLDYATVWSAAGAPQAVFAASPNALAAAAGARIIRVS